MPGHVHDNESLPTLRLSTAQGPLSCASCGMTANPLLPVCLWCFSDDKLEEPKNAGPQASSPVEHSAPMLLAQVDLRDDSLMDALSSSFPLFLKQDGAQDAFTGLFTAAQSEENSVAMSQPSIPHATLLGPLQAGSSPPVSHGLRFRSRSLFSLTASSRSNTPRQDSTSAASSMINAAKSVARRMSSSTQLCPQPIPGHDPHRYEEKHPILSNIDSDSHNRFIRRKKRLASPVPVPHIPATYELETSLHSPPTPIAISLSLNQSRPGTPESSSSCIRDAVAREEMIPVKLASTPQKNEEAVPALFKNSSLPAPGQRQQQETTRTSTIRWSTDDRDRQQHPEFTNVVPSLQGSPTSSRRSSVAHNTPRLGHPSRPYYSAIRKHCMSSPASSRPASVNHGFADTVMSFAAPSSSSSSTVPPRERPSSTSGQNYYVNNHPPSAFSMSSITPFTRRPVSIGAVPASSASGGRLGLAMRGMSVFDIEDEAVDDDDDDDVDEKDETWEESRGKKSNSLSRAFTRTGEGFGKKRRWSSSLFSESNVKDKVKGSDGAESRRAAQGVNMNLGLSMSGETELRMALALMQQQEEAEEKQTMQQDQGEGAAMPQKPERERKYRFKQAVDISGKQQQPPPLVDHHVDGRGNTDCGAKGKGRKVEPGHPHHHSTVLDRMKRFKREIKGLLTSSSNSNASPTSAT